MSEFPTISEQLELNKTINAKLHAKKCHFFESLDMFLYPSDIAFVNIHVTYEDKSSLFRSCEYAQLKVSIVLSGPEKHTITATWRRETMAEIKRIRTGIVEELRSVL